MNTKTIEAINFWQTSGQFHPLTCGKNSQHVLVAKEVNGKIILVCPECDYIQLSIPPIFDSNFVNNWQTMRDKTRELFTGGRSSTGQSP